MVQVEVERWGRTQQDPGSEPLNNRGTASLNTGHTQKNASSILRLGSSSYLTDLKAKCTSTVQMLNFYLSNEQISVYYLQQSKKNLL